MIIQNIKTKEKYQVMRYRRILGLLVGGSYTLVNLKTKKIMSIAGNEFNKKYEVLRGKQ